jgi:hypothetical protein
MLYAAQTSGTCWWCRTAPADSREHKLKRSDLVRQFGRGPYPELVSSREGQLRPVQGPNSKLRLLGRIEELGAEFLLRHPARRRRRRDRPPARRVRGLPHRASGDVVATDGD